MKQISLFGDEHWEDTPPPQKNTAEDAASEKSEPVLPSDLEHTYSLDEKQLEENYIREIFIFDDSESITAAEPTPNENQPHSVSEEPNPAPSLADAAPKKGRGRMKLSEMENQAEALNIPQDEELFQKRYYSIGSVAEMFRVNISLLRYWENEFDILKPKKNGKGDRLFRPEDIKTIQLIYHLLREKKYTLQGAKDFLKKNRNADKHFEVVESLKNLKSFLLELKSTV